MSLAPPPAAADPPDPPRAACCLTLPSVNAYTQDAGAFPPGRGGQPADQRRRGRGFRRDVPPGAARRSGPRPRRRHRPAGDRGRSTRSAGSAARRVHPGQGAARARSARAYHLHLIGGWSSACGRARRWPGRWGERRRLWLAHDGLGDGGSGADPAAYLIIWLYWAAIGSRRIGRVGAGSWPWPGGRVSCRKAVGHVKAEQPGDAEPDLGGPCESVPLAWTPSWCRAA